MRAFHVRVARIARGLLAAALTLAVTPNVATEAAAARTQTWVAHNPGGGGAFNSPVISSTGAWVVGSDLSGVCISLNQGRAWRMLGAAHGLAATHVASLTSSPQDGRLVIGTDDGIYTANATGTKATQVYKGGYVSGIAFAADKTTVYAGWQPTWNVTQPHLLRSRNGGSAWADASSLPANLRIVSLRTHPVDPQAVIALSGIGRFASGPKKAWLSTNGGSNWTQIAGEIGDIEDIAYAYDSDNLNRMYATTDEALFRSENAGGTWTRVAARSGAILADPGRLRLLNPALFKPWNDEGTEQSNDHGATWTRLASSNSWSHGWSKSYEAYGFGQSFQGIAQTFAARGTTVISADSQFIYASSDSGKTFANVSTRKTAKGSWQSTGCDNVVPETVELSPADPLLLYVGYHDLGLFRSDDGGSSWIPLNEAAFTGDWQGNGGNTMSVVSDPTRADVVWAQLGADKNSVHDSTSNPTVLARSDRRGAKGSWRIAQGLPPNSRIISGIAVDPRSPVSKRHVFVAADNTVYRSNDDGLNFSPVMSCGCANVWATDRAIFVGGSGGLWRSASGDENSFSPVEGISTFGTQEDFWADSYAGPLDLASSRTRPEEMWLAVKGDGFFRSLDAGSSWTRMRADNLAYTVAIDSAGRVLTGSSSANVAGGYSAKSGGLTVGTAQSNGTINWQSANAGLEYPFATKVRMGSLGTRWHISPGQGLLSQVTIPTG
jgi:hypothetical protein